MRLGTLRFLAVVVLSAICLPVAARAQPAEKIPRIGVLWPIAEDRTLEAFRHALRDLGYVEGKTMAIEYRSSNGNDSLLPELAAELVRLNADLIVTWGVTAGRIARQATTAIPIVNGSMSDPVRAKLVASLARPGGNVTGLTSANPETSAKRVQFMKELVPGLARLAVLATTAPTATFALRETEAVAPSLGTALRTVVVQHPDDFDEAYAAIARERAEAVIVLPDLLFDQYAKRLIELAAMHRLPAMYSARTFVETGGLISYAPSYPDMFRRAAAYVDKILKGANPADLPVERASKFELVVNRTTARSLDLDIPPTILALADEVIE